MKTCKRTDHPVVPEPPQYKGFRGRSIDQSEPVMVYKNLHNGKLSIRQGKYVVAHVDNVLLTDVSFVVREAGRQRVIAEGRKNVHAFVKGMVVATNTGDHDTTDRKVSYNPYKHGYFYEVGTQDEATLTSIDTLLCDAEHGLFII